MRVTLRLILATGIAIAPAFAQEPTKPAAVLWIDREAIKEGRTVIHEKVEAEYVAAFRKAQFPGHYFALATMSGPNEVWFVQPMASFAANEEFEKATEKEPLKSALATLTERDGELRESSRSYWAVYRPDMSYRPDTFKPEKMRFVTAETFRVRLGQEDAFMNGVQAYFGGYKKGNVDLCVQTYEVTAGAPAGTYLLFTMMDSMKVLDQEPERMKAVMEGMGQEAFNKLMKDSGQVLLSIEDTLLEVKPGMSYPDKAMEEADPAFWKPKMAMKAAIPASKKSGE
jgi:hypothetical protein